MPNQKFAAREPYRFANNAVGWAPGGPFDCLGPYARVERCPIAGTPLRLTCYATGYADTPFSIPAATVYRRKYIGGFFMVEEDRIEFHPLDRFRDRLPEERP